MEVSGTLGGRVIGCVAETPTDGPPVEYPLGLGCRSLGAGPGGGSWPGRDVI